MPTNASERRRLGGHPPPTHSTTTRPAIQLPPNPQPTASPPAATQVAVFCTSVLLVVILVRLICPKHEGMRLSWRRVIASLFGGGRKRREHASLLTSKKKSRRRRRVRAGQIIQDIKAHSLRRHSILGVGGAKRRMCVRTAGSQGERVSAEPALPKRQRMGRQLLTLEDSCSVVSCRRRTSGRRRRRVHMC